MEKGRAFTECPHPAGFLSQRSWRPAGSRGACEIDPLVPAPSHGRGGPQRLNRGPTFRPVRGKVQLPPGTPPWAQLCLQPCPECPESCRGAQERKECLSGFQTELCL